jgi:hypothetical protein
MMFIWIQRIDAGFARPDGVPIFSRSGSGQGQGRARVLVSSTGARHRRQYSNGSNSGISKGPGRLHWTPMSSSQSPYEHGLYGTGSGSGFEVNRARLRHRMHAGSVVRRFRG